MSSKGIITLQTCDEILLIVQNEVNSLYTDNKAIHFHWVISQKHSLIPGPFLHVSVVLYILYICVHVCTHTCVCDVVYIVCICSCVHTYMCGDQRLNSGVFLIHTHLTVFSKMYFLGCVCFSVRYLCVPCVSRCSWKPEEGIRFPGAVVTGSCEPWMWVLRAKLRSSGRAGSDLNHWAIPPNSTHFTFEAAFLPEPAAHGFSRVCWPMSFKGLSVFSSSLSLGFRHSCEWGDPSSSSPRSCSNCSASGPILLFLKP